MSDDTPVYKDHTEREIREKIHNAIAPDEPQALANYLGKAFPGSTLQAYPDAEVEKAIVQIAKDAGIKGQIIVLGAEGDYGSGLGTITTKEGAHIIVVGMDLPTDAAIIGARHEVEHIKNRDNSENSLYSKITGAGTFELHRIETLADMGVAESCHGKELATLLAGQHVLREFAYESRKESNSLEGIEPEKAQKLKEAGFPNLSFDDAERILYPAHPPDMERVAVLMDATKRLEEQGHCPAPGQQPPSKYEAMLLGEQFDLSALRQISGGQETKTHGAAPAGARPERSPGLNH